MVVIIQKGYGNREMDKYSELIEQRRSMGELDHPESTVINLKNVSHLITEYFWDGDNRTDFNPGTTNTFRKYSIKANQKWSYSRCIISWYGFI